MDSLSTIMAVESRTPTKNPKTQTIRKILDQEGPITTLLRFPSHKGIQGNEKAGLGSEKSAERENPNIPNH
jgi:hypothetical protein